ncbi:tRNA pseudouridine(55) synthase TruB [Acidaminobacter sp.]|uniref:tRNA pseudouridine(55) synthase TruB n=1 Tax=Acidaminobacter sp. TaxID=1872102 RepID=UPI00137F75C3|nr:tRNA pseudouridine(55) synthase TruB [Acidaminobacter sp.]MDK9709566.1 tRNA pseudouridine(55) synthase TruB [Acidaminobacter sp.]MZQ96522.1 tRNA pseudouridine(55) synthase TruB [Acidaminobacter sp.]
MNGILNVYKPSGMTSHDVVAILRRLTRMKRIGHTGTLDPMATGVLPVCLGKATRIVEFLSSEDKAYRCEMSLGKVSDTQDIWGEVTLTGGPLPTTEAFRDALMSMVGEIRQIPPMYSAVKVGGRKLYELAREGIEIEREARIRWIRSIEILALDQDQGSAVFNVVCSKGTYIRTLCHDVGQKLGCGAVMTALERTASGTFTLENAITLEALETMDKSAIEAALHSIDAPFKHLPSIQVDERVGRLLINGVRTDLTPMTQKLESADVNQFRIYQGSVFIGLGTFQGPDGKPTLEKLLMSGDDHADI